MAKIESTPQKLVLKEGSTTLTLDKDAGKATLQTKVLLWSKKPVEFAFADIDDIAVKSDKDGLSGATIYHSVLHRRSGATEDATVRLGPLTLDVDAYRVSLLGRPLDLTFKEFELLRFLAERPGRVFTRPALMREVWGYDFYGGTRTVDVHIRRLRAKLGPEHEGLIGTVRGVGYRAADL